MAGDSAGMGMGSKSLRPVSAVGYEQLLDTASALVRIGLAALAGVLLLLSETDSSDLTDSSAPSWWGALLSVAVIASLVQVFLRGRFWTGALLIETLAAAMIIGAAPEPSWPLQLYLLAPAILAGFSFEPTRASLLGAIAPAVAGLQSVVAPWADPWSLWQVVAWVVVVSLVGTGSALLHAYRRESLGDADAYAIAVGLLQQLDSLSRRLPVGLDSGTVAKDALAKLAESYPEEMACLVLYPATEGANSGLLVGDEAASSGLTGDVWKLVVQSGRPQVTQRAGPDSVTSTMAIPLLAQGSVEAVAIIARQRGRLHQSDARRVERLLVGTGLRLAAANLFTEVRETAVAEERSRVGAQIHDGIAQDLVGLAYSLDALALTSSDHDQVREIGRASEEVRRLVDDLRLSIFTLRTDLGTDERLGTALAGYARQVAERSGMRVHVDIDDSEAHLHAGAGHELMRIAQEAITNARKHSRARTLWVALRVAPDGARLTVADDGLGLGAAQETALTGGVGTRIIRERGDRLGGTVSIGDRPGGGVEVTVEIGERWTSPWPLALGIGSGGVATAASASRLLDDVVV